MQIVCELFPFRDLVIMDSSFQYFVILQTAHKSPGQRSELPVGDGCNAYGAGDGRICGTHSDTAWTIGQKSPGKQGKAHSGLYHGQNRVSPVPDDGLSFLAVFHVG